MRFEYDGNGRAVGDDGGVRRGSSLRVTFLVNIWTARWPSGVGVPPGSMRADIVESSRALSAGAVGAGEGGGWRGAQAGPPPGPSSSFRNSPPPVVREEARVRDHRPAVVVSPPPGMADRF